LPAAVVTIAASFTIARLRADIPLTRRTIKIAPSASLFYPIAERAIVDILSLSLSPSGVISIGRDTYLSAREEPRSLRRSLLANVLLLLLLLLLLFGDSRDSVFVEK